LIPFYYVFYLNDMHKKNMRKKENEEEEEEKNI
jgi:hypothetical protein